MNCPKCGAKWSTMAGGKTKFYCGSIAVDECDVSPQSELCKDIEHDKKQLEFLRKWREVVLRDAPAFLDNYTIEHVLVADPSDSETVRKAFDAAVRKEME